jgi:hypothetical protein
VHARGLAGDDRLTADEVGRVLGIEVDLAVLDLRQRQGHVGLLHEAEREQHLEHARLDLGDPVPFLGLDTRRLVGVDGHDERRLVQHLVVAEVVDQRGRGLAEVLEHEHRAAADALDRRSTRRAPRRSDARHGGCGQPPASGRDARSASAPSTRPR